MTVRGGSKMASMNFEYKYFRLKECCTTGNSDEIYSVFFQSIIHLDIESGLLLLRCIESFLTKFKEQSAMDSVVFCLAYLFQ